MISRMEKIRLGVFLLVSGTVLVVTVVVLAGMNLMKAVESYNVKFEESVSGLEVGATVKYNGVRVGQVSDIKFAENDITKVEVVLELRKGTPIKTDTKAVLTGMGITGLKFVELTGGSSRAKRLKRGGTIKAGHSLMGTLGDKAESITTKTDLALSKINALLSEKNIYNFEDIVANIKNITAKVDTLVADNEGKIAKIVDDLSQASNDVKEGAAAANRSMAELDEIMAASGPNVQEIVRNVTETTRRFKKTSQALANVDIILERVDQAVASLNQKINAVDVAGISDGVKTTLTEAAGTLSSIRRIVDRSRENVHRSTYSLKRTMRNLEEFSAMIREQPSLLLSNKKPKGRPAPED